MEGHRKRGVQRIIHPFRYTFTGLKAAWIHDINAFRYTFAGLKAAWKYEGAFRQEIILLILVIPLGIWIGASGTQRAILIGFYLIIPIAELLNSSIETIVDRISQDHHILSGRAKDLGAAAVFLSICTAIITWGIIVWERFF